MGRLDGKVAIITGSGGGIGRAHALHFAQEGAKVVVNDLGGARDGTGAGTRMADQVVGEIRASGGTAVASYDSVSTREGAKGIVDTALRSFGRLDVLVNNAGILRDRSLLKMEEEAFDVVIAVHLKGTFLCTQAAAAVMKEQGQGGRIINTTSLSGLEGNFGQANYAAAKAGIYGLTRVAAIELQKYGITCNAVAPVAKTRLTEDLPIFQGVGDDMLGPQFIAPVVAFLASDLAADITGRVVAIQGRWVYEYQMRKTQGIRKDEGMWSAADLKERWAAIEKAEYQ